ncbi:MAG TPA: TolC family protein [Kofleriaceae bacterium]|nr:TolC family protein [Kofleriaceae bacterium]
MAQPPTTTPPARPAGAEVLTLERAIQIAMQQQPTLRQTRAQVEAARGRVDQARVPQRPTVTLSASAAVGSAPLRPCDADPTQTCGGFFDPTVSTGLAAIANWRIFDFGQTRANIRAAELSAEATAATVDVNALDIRVSVESAFLEAIARQRLVRVAEATVKSEEIHLEQAKKFVAAQAKDPIEVAQAQARAANARSALAQAQSAEAIALANLRAAIGWIDPTRSPTVESTWPVPPVADPPDLAALVASSRQHRAEILQLDKQVQASEANLDAAKASRRPVLSATASTQWGPDQNDWTPEPTWSAGVTLSWQLFDGGRSKADQRVARANILSAEAQRDAFLVNLTTQLDLSRSQIVANRANVQASDEAVTAARAQLKLAEARYAQGLGSQIELADAQTAVTTAEGNLVQAQWQLADAWAQLRRAVGEQ